MKVLKFGGKSLANGSPLEQALDILKAEADKGKVVTVLSARGNSTNELEDLLEKAAAGEEYDALLDKFFEYQVELSDGLNFAKEFQEINKILGGVSLLGEYSLKIKDKLLSFGEIISCKAVVQLLKESNYKARFVDSRELIKTDEAYGSARVLLDISEQNVTNFFKEADEDTIEVVTGFIGSNLQNQTTTLGRNG